MKSMTQEEKVINMMKRPIPKKKSGNYKAKNDPGRNGCLWYSAFS